MSRFFVGLSPDIPRDGDELRFDLGLDVLDAEPDVEWGILPGEPAPELSAAQLEGVDGLLLWGARLSEASLEGADRLRVVARIGVGFDKVDVEACTRRGIAVTITTDGVRRPMAVSAILCVLALAHRLVQKDRITRTGRWRDAWDHVGTGLSGRTLGIVGAGNIGREVFRLAKPFDLRHIAADPFVTPEVAAAEGFELTDLDALMATADFVCVLCPLNEETRHIIDARRLALMKPTAFLINISRGALVDEEALAAALRADAIAGAALDVFEQEPADPSNPLLAFDNVIATPHSICHTEELFRFAGGSAARSVLDVKAGRVPEYVVNPEALRQPARR
jgi:phosphoglycerate dehydrogenase-like enzyme